MGHDGFEPSTNCLRGNCSTVELMTLVVVQPIITIYRELNWSATGCKEKERAWKDLNLRQSA